MNDAIWFWFFVLAAGGLVFFLGFIAGFAAGLDDAEQVYKRKVE